MNERFKFRAWDKSFHRMIYDIFFFWKENKITVYKLEEDGSKYYLPNSHIVLEQCTGLKDKHGWLIYEGDIVNILCEIEEQGVIEWALEEAQFVIRAEQAGFVANFDNYSGIDLEVIGNIHENAYLLEAQNG